MTTKIAQKLALLAPGLACVSLIAFPNHTSAQEPAAAKQNASPAKAAAGSSADSSYSLWETVSRIDRFSRTDTKPSISDRRVIQECVRSQDMNAKSIAKRDSSASGLIKGCWITQEREDENRSQVKWACNSGTSFEIATRRESETRFGYQIVINVPGEGGLSVRGESMRVAANCVPPASPEPPPQGAR